MTAEPPASDVCLGRYISPNRPKRLNESPRISISTQRNMTSTLRRKRMHTWIRECHCHWPYTSLLPFVDRGSTRKGGRIRVEDRQRGPWNPLSPFARFRPLCQGMGGCSNHHWHRESRGTDQVVHPFSLYLLALFVFLFSVVLSSPSRIHHDVRRVTAYIPGRTPSYGRPRRRIRYGGV